MADAERRPTNALTTPATVLAVGLMLAGWILGAQLKSSRLADRYVTVRGLVERQIKSDFAIWPITFQETGDDLQPVTTRVESDKQAILKFLTDQGFTGPEVTAGLIQVRDTQVDLDRTNKPPHRFIMKQTLTLTTTKVDAATAAAQQAMELLKSGIVLVTENPYGQTSISYLFNGLNSVKPDMITEATRNARTAADRFAADSGSRVGSIRSAEQGIFSITAANGGMPAGGDTPYAGSDTSSIMKKVRVVTTVQYYLEK